MASFRFLAVEEREPDVRLVSIQDADCFFGSKAPALLTEFAMLRAMWPVRHVVFNLAAAVHGISSRGLGSLFNLKRFLGDHGHRLVLCEMTDTMKEIFRRNALDTTFEIAPTVSSALAKLIPSSPTSGAA